MLLNFIRLEYVTSLLNIQRQATVRLYRLNHKSFCHVAAIDLCLFLTVPWLRLQCVILAFSGHILTFCVFDYSLILQRTYK